MDVRRGTEVDFQAMELLRAQRTNIKRKAAYLSFLYQNPAGSPMIWVAYEDDRLVGYLIAVPQIMQQAGKTFLGYMVAEAVVVEELEGTGVYRRLTGVAYATMIEEGAVLRYEYPYGSALYAQTNRLGATYIEDIPVGIKIFSFRKHLKGRMKNQWLANVIGRIADMINRPREAKMRKVRPGTSFVSLAPSSLDIELLWRQLAHKYPMCIDRSRSFLTWRLEQHPDKQLYRIIGATREQLEGYLIYKIEEKALANHQVVRACYVMDLVATDESIAYDLLAHVEEKMRVEMDFITLWMPRDARFPMLGLQRRYRSTRLKIAMVGDLLDESYEKDEWLRAKKWHIMPIDADLY